MYYQEEDDDLLYSCILIDETEFAILVRYVDIEVWLPKSQISYTEMGEGRIDVSIPEWLAIEKGFE